LGFLKAARDSASEISFLQMVSAIAKHSAVQQRLANYRSLSYGRNISSDVSRLQLLGINTSGRLNRAIIREQYVSLNVNVLKAQHFN
jgi:hypothetical protein